MEKIMRARTSRYWTVRVSTRRHGHGFTLIELLVAISIITLLIAMMLPLLTTARDAAKQTLCKSQMRQHGIALDMYRYDNDRFFPGHYDDMDPPNAGHNRPYTYRLGPYINHPITDRSSTPDGHGTANLNTGNTGRHIFYCPGALLLTPQDFDADYFMAAQDAIMWGPDWDTHVHTYGLTSFLGFVLNYDDAYRAADPVTNSFVHDLANNQEHDSPSAAFFAMDGALQSRIDYASPNIRYRHGQQRSTNILFIDGHVKDMTRERVEPLLLDDTFASRGNTVR